VIAPALDMALVSGRRWRYPRAQSMGPHTRSGAAQEVQSALDSIRRLVQFLRLSARAAERAGLSAAQLFVLHELAEGPALSVNDLAARTLTHQSSVSVVLRRLAARQLVTRRRAGDDGRRVEVTLTVRGRAAVQRFPETSQERLIAGLGHLASPHRRGLARGLSALLTTLEIPAAEPAAMFFEEPAGRSRRS
jgi:DNA-binding MarR family transcriptional regulator